MPFERYTDATGKKRWRSVTRINDYLVGNVVAVKKVPLRYRVKYRATLLAAARAARDAGVKLYVRSSFRFYAEQVALYDRYLHHGGNLAAVPGTSRHEKGNALDLGDLAGHDAKDVPKIKRALLARGFVFAVASEDWHVELP